MGGVLTGVDGVISLGNGTGIFPSGWMLRNSEVPHKHVGALHVAASRAKTFRPG